MMNFSFCTNQNFGKPLLGALLAAIAFVAPLPVAAQTAATPAAAVSAPLPAAAPVSASLPPAAGSWVQAAFQPQPLYEEVVGTLQPKTSTTLSARVMGIVRDIPYREGDLVKEGDLLIRLEAQEITSDLAGAKASLTEVQASSQEIQSHIRTARSAKESAEAEMKLAEVSFQRIKELYEKKSVTQQEFDQAQTRFLQTKTGVAQADSQISSLQAKLAQTSARNEQARAGISKASTYQSLTEIRAPFNGRVISRKAESGTLAAPGVPLMVIEDVGSMRFEAVVPERLLSSLPEGASVAVRIDALGTDPLPGTVVEIAPGADILSHTFIVKIALPDQTTLRTGLFARGLVYKGEEKMLLIPATAIERRGQLEGVTLNLNNRPLYRLIKTGRTFGPLVEVLSGLNPGDSFAAVVPGK
jgi:multidrug efflux pump subunit AcrA (membrane-fusion protein)